MQDIHHPTDPGETGSRPVRGTLRRFNSFTDMKADEAGRDPDRLQDLADAQALRKASEARHNDPDTPGPKRTRGRSGRGR